MEGRSQEVVEAGFRLGSAHPLTVFHPDRPTSPQRESEGVPFSVPLPPPPPQPPSQERLLSPAISVGAVGTRGGFPE